MVQWGKTLDKELLVRYSIAVLVNGTRNTHLRLSIEKCKPTSLGNLLERIDKYITQEESDMVIKDCNSRWTMNLPIIEKMDEDGARQKRPRRSASEVRVYTYNSLQTHILNQI